MGKRQVSRITSADRGSSASAVICTSAAGGFIPPMLIFRRQKFKRELEDGVPAGIIFACYGKEWMKLGVFEKCFDHFLAHTKPTANDRARENFVRIICLPLHTSHEKQLLDVGVMYPLSHHYDKGLEKWMTNHPGCVITDYQVSTIFCEAYLMACYPIMLSKYFKTQEYINMTMTYSVKKILLQHKQQMKIQKMEIQMIP
ncbi:hypothetical protein PR048_028967 [Dryococelus australis]|uniref:DDE-1 domain-containing protein n=1 Tax=Dryococelus australis TaxID=614101 RepID=A0ABQ9GFR1_9NEOP|nr:hypothetical protein PR048_028967 [Dryococelus australis]